MDGCPGVLPFATVFQSYQDDGWVIMKGCEQWNPFTFEKILVSREDRIRNRLISRPSELQELERDT